MKGLFKRFRQDAKGTVAITFAIGALPLFLAAGVAVDFVQASALKSKLQTSLDAGALAAASSASMTNPKRVALAEAVFAKNWADYTGGDSKLEATPVFLIRNGGVTGSAELKMPTAFMRIAGIKSVDLNSDVAVSIPSNKKAEVALVLDYSYSMTEAPGGRVKYRAMRDAAADLVEDLKVQAPGKVKIGLVPFSHMVRVTLPKAYVKGQGKSGDWTGCTVDRLENYNTTTTTPDSDDDDTKWGQAYPNQSNINYSCAPFAANKLTVAPLTTDLDVVADQIRDMRPAPVATAGYTHIALGAEFGWHLLSPNAPFAAASYSDDETKKYLVVLTDGDQTEFAFGSRERKGPPGPSAPGVLNGEDNLASICAKAKTAGITVLTIAYDMKTNPRGIATTNRLRNCATDPDTNFFIADDGRDMADVFNDIKGQIASQVYVSK